MYAKNCGTKGCDFRFTLARRPHKELTGKCPKCQEETHLADAKALPEQPTAEAAKEGK